MSGGGILISPDKTPLPPGSESPTKSHSKKNTPSETPIQVFGLPSLSLHSVVHVVAYQAMFSIIHFTANPSSIIIYAISRKEVVN